MITYIEELERAMKGEGIKTVSGRTKVLVDRETITHAIDAMRLVDDLRYEYEGMTDTPCAGADCTNLKSCPFHRLLDALFGLAPTKGAIERGWKQLADQRIELSKRERKKR